MSKRVCVLCMRAVFAMQVGGLGIAGRNVVVLGYTTRFRLIETSILRVIE
jgi:hypothetical protein